MLVLQDSAVKSLYEHENLMSRFLLMAVSLAQFCLVLWLLRHHWRRCLEWFIGSLFLCSGVMKQGKLFGFLHRSSMYLEIVLMLFSPSAQPFTFFCYYVSVFSAALRQGQFVRCLSCATRHFVHGLTQLKADLKYLSLVWASVLAASVGSSTMLTAFLTKYLPLILQLATPLWGSEKSQPSGDF